MTFKQWISEKVARRIAYGLPRVVVSWAAIRLIAYATTGQYGNQEVPALTAMEAVRRWNAR